MSSPNAKTVVVGMSGGVDSSVAALLLKQQGYRVIGMFMKNWEEEDESGVCKASIEYDDVVRVCDALDIPHYTVNFTQEYLDEVFQYFIKEYEKGHTPNPDILCNKEIKFKALLDKALAYGADFLATGHYVQVKNNNGKFCLSKGLDPGKDQSYFLHAIDGATLDKVLFPIGSLQKSVVRAIAAEHNLSTAQKKDSTGICFIGKRNFKEFLGGYIPSKKGKFENLAGEVVGEHEGCAFYTMGQRRGLAIGGAGEAWYVVGKDVARNVVVVEQGDSHPALFCDTLTAIEASWIDKAPSIPFKCKAKVRYRQPDQSCTITSIEGDALFVEFDEPQRAVTVGQSVVFYDGDICLGGAVIDGRGPTYYERNIPLVLR